MKSVMITGANSGIGKDTARQFALLPETEKVYMACRNPHKAEAAKRDLEQETGRSIFEIVIMDVSNLESVRKAVQSLDQPIEGLVMNAGGVVGPTAGEVTEYGVNKLTSSNLLGHVVLLDELLASGKLTDAAIYAGSEAARGVSIMGMAKPKLKDYSVDEFEAIAKGTFFKSFDALDAYGYVKLMANLWMSSMARKHPSIRLVTISPGGTSGTAGMDNLPPVKRFFFKHIAGNIMPALGVFHGVETAAQRFVSALNDSEYQSGRFYASKKGVSGEIEDQGILYPEFNNPRYQDNANEALHRFVA